MFIRGRNKLSARLKVKVKRTWADTKITWAMKDGSIHLETKIQIWSPLTFKIQSEYQTLIIFPILSLFIVLGVFLPVSHFPLRMRG